MPVKVGVLGYGTIGKRVADAVARQPDLRLVGVAKTRPSFEALEAVTKKYPLFVAGTGRRADFEAAGLPVAGTAQELIDDSEVVVDCSPGDVGKENAARYREAKVRAVFQGGEEADVAEVSFNALANYEAARDRRTVRVVSCNTTGLARAASVLRPFGIEQWEATLVRRAADPQETERGPINGIVPTFKLPSHHGPDVRTVLPDLPIMTTALVVPTTLMHLHTNLLTLARPPTSVHEIVEAFRRSPRFHLFEKWEHVDGTPQVMEFARDRSSGGRPDMMENVLWTNGIQLDGKELRFFQAIHQESIVVPENIDAIRAMFGLAPDGPTSIERTDRALGIPRPG